MELLSSTHHDDDDVKYSDDKCYDEYYSYLDENYNKFDDGFSITHIRKLTNKHIANHIKEINNDVTRVNFDNIYSYERQQMIVHKFDKIF